MRGSVQHRNLAEGRWATLTLSEQLGNVGSEIGRAINSKNIEDKKMASYRALELIDLTLAEGSFKTKRGKMEITRAREVVCDFLLGDNEYKSNARSLEKYFMSFALAARHNK